jgi:hypothetical protein
VKKNRGNNMEDRISINRKVKLLEEKNSYNKKVIYTQISVIFFLIISILVIYLFFNKKHY